MMGGKPSTYEPGDEPVSVVKWVDGTLLDTVWRVR
jgi:citrate lyase alpha subunit